MEQRRLIPLLVFLFSLVMLWEAWLRHNQPAPQPQAERPVATQQGAGLGEVPQSQRAAVAPVSGAIEEAQARRMVVETDRFTAEISERGGDIVFLAFKDHSAREDHSKPFILFDDGRAGHVYRVQSGLIGAGLPNHRSQWQLPAEAVRLAPGQDVLEVRLTAQADDGALVTKVLRFKRGEYLVEVRHELANAGTAPIEASTYYQFLRDGLPAEEHSLFGVRTFTGPAIYTAESKYKKIDFEDVLKGKAEFPRLAQDGWIAMVQHYFVAAWLPQEGVQREFYVRPVEGGLFQAGVILPLGTVAPGEAKEGSVRLYAGPQTQSVLGTLAPGFDLVVDYGWFTVIAAPLFWVLSWLYKLTGNWGWAIVLVTVLLKAIFYPLSAASYRSMAKMRALTPRLQRLKELYGDDKARMQQEMMRIYQEEKVNPLGGCLPILVQIPVFIALYWVLLNSVEMRQAPWILWIQDLSMRDPYFVLPILMGASMFVQMKLNPQPVDPMQAKLMLAMPIVFTVMFLWFPAGLVLYWLTNNVLSIAQQWLITRQIEAGGKASK